MNQTFSYSQAFSRNIGWVTPSEQNLLRGKRVAIAGMGGVGGVHLLTLARLGVGAFHIADFDRFDLATGTAPRDEAAGDEAVPLRCLALDTGAAVVGYAVTVSDEVSTHPPSPSGGI